MSVRVSARPSSAYASTVQRCDEHALVAPRRAPLITVRSAEAQVAAAHARDNLAFCTEIFWHLTTKDPLVHSFHLDVLCAVAEAVIREAIPGALINVPPGMSKSTICSRIAVPWAWLEQPSLRVIGASHTLGLQERFNRHRRAICRSRAYQDLIPRAEDGEPLWRLDPEVAGVRLFGTADTSDERTIAGGWCAAASRKGGVATGDHADLHVYDDPLSGRERHTIERLRTNSWVTDTMASRFGERRSILAVLQMLHAKGPTSALLAAHPQLVRVVMPMVYDAGRDDYEHSVDLGAPSSLQRAAFEGDRDLAWFRERLLRAGLALEGDHLWWSDPRADAELLCPARFGPSHVEKRRRHPAVHAAEDQQHPTSASASVIHEAWWKRWTVLPPGRPDEMIWGVDTQSGAVHDVTQPDWTVMSVWARWGPRLYLIEEARGRWSTPDMARVMYLLGERWGDARRLVERRNAGPSLVSLLRDHMSGLILVPPKEQDIQRIESAGVRIQAGDVFAPAPDASPPSFLTSGWSWASCELRADDPRLPRELRPVHPPEDPVLAVVGAPGWIEESLAEWNQQPGSPFNDRPAAGALVLLTAQSCEPSAPAPRGAPTTATSSRWAQSAPWGR